MSHYDVKDGGIVVLLQSYHSDYFNALPTDSILVTQLWDGFHDTDWRDAIDHIGGDLEAISKQVWVSRVGYYQKELWINPPVENPMQSDGLGSGGYDLNLYLVQGSVEAVSEAAVRFAENMSKAVHDVSGDDDYFDYFPGGVMLLHQLCKATDNEVAYRKFYDEAMTVYGDLEPENIPKWEGAGW